jgi:hypothetical protein
MHTEHADILRWFKGRGEAFDFRLWPREVKQQAQVMTFSDRSCNRCSSACSACICSYPRENLLADRTANDCLNVDVPPASTARSKCSRGFKQMHTEHADILGGSKAIGEAFDFQL